MHCLIPAPGDTVPMKFRLLRHLLLVALLSHGSARSEDWPTYRHDYGRSAATGEKLPLPLRPLWTFRSRQSHRTPLQKGELHLEITPEFNKHSLSLTTAGDLVFFTSVAEGRLGCLEAATGKTRWEFVAGSAINRSATIAGGRVYVGSDDGHVYCLAADTGSLIWKHKASPAERWMFSFGQLTSVWPVRTDIVVDKEVAYFGVGVFPHDGTFVCALDTKTGKRLWRNGIQCETLNRWSLSPVGHIYLTEHNLYMPMDFKQFHWALFNSYKRTDGTYDAWAGTDPDNPAGYGEPFYPLMGAMHGGRRYRGNEAHTIEIVVDEKSKKKNYKAERLWNVETKGYHCDLDSVMGSPVMRGTVTRYDPDMCPVIYAGGTVFSAAFKGDAEKGASGKLFARHPDDGRELWSHELAEWPNQIIAANGRLFVSTRDGRIHAFGGAGAASHGTLEEGTDKDLLPADPSLAAAADEIIGIAREIRGEEPVGEALVLDCETGALAMALAARTELRLYAVFASEEKARAAREAFNQAGLHLSRLTALHLPPGQSLPYPSRMMDFLFSEGALLSGTLPSDPAELARLQKPLRGVAVLGGADNSANALPPWTAATGQEDWSIRTGAKGTAWATRRAPRLPEGGGWTHALGDAGNTMCSHDGVLRAPLGIAWYGPPYSSRGRKGISPPIIVDGVLVTQFQDYIHKDLNYTQGHDQYTGRQLWQRPNSMTDTIAQPGSIFQRFLEVIVQIDPWTGKEIRRYFPPLEGGHWSAMAAESDGSRFYLRSSGKKDEKDWAIIMAVDPVSGKPLWSLGGPGQPEQWPTWNAIADNRLYFLRGNAEGARRAESMAEMKALLQTMPGKDYREFEAKIEEHTYQVLQAVDATTGKVLYQHGVDTSNAGGGWTRSVVSGGRRSYEPPLGGAVIAHGGVVLFASAAGADKSWAVWPSGGYQARALAVHDGATGKLLWYRFANYRARPVMTEDYVVAEPWAFDLRTGTPKTRRHPITGEEAQWAFCRYNKQCGTFAGSRHLMFGRSRGIGYHDLLGDDGLYTFLHSRASCWIDTSSGGGMMIKPPHAIGCKCEVSMPFTVALAQVPQQPAVPQTFAQPGTELPVRHLHLDLGGTGERRDHEGNLWVIPRPGEHLLLLQFNATPTFEEQGGPVRRSGNYTPIANTKRPFLFASALRGMKDCLIPVTTPEAGPFRYRVRLGFSALPGDQPGQRVFDVLLNGKPVLRDFDIMKESGQSDYAVWKEFEIEIAKDLTIALTSKTGTGSVDRMPLISAAQVLRIE